MRWGGAAQICCLLFTNCIYWVHLGMGREGETPAQFFLAHWRSKKVVQVVQIRGGVVEVIWTKSKRTATFFGRPSLRLLGQGNPLWYMSFLLMNISGKDYIEYSFELLKAKVMKMNHVLNQYLEFLIKKSPFLSILDSLRALFWFPGILSWFIYWILFELNNSLNWILGKQYWIKYWIESFLVKFKHWIESDRVSQRARTRFKLSS